MRPSGGRRGGRARRHALPTARQTHQAGVNGGRCQRLVQRSAGRHRGRRASSAGRRLRHCGSGHAAGHGAALLRIQRPSAKAPGREQCEHHWQEQGNGRSPRQGEPAVKMIREVEEGLRNCVFALPAGSQVIKTIEPGGYYRVTFYIDHKWHLQWVETPYARRQRAAAAPAPHGGAAALRPRARASGRGAPQARWGTGRPRARGGSGRSEAPRPAKPEPPPRGARTAR